MPQPDRTLNSSHENRTKLIVSRSLHAEAELILFTGACRTTSSQYRVTSSCFVVRQLFRAVSSPDIDVGMFLPSM